MSPTFIEAARRAQIIEAGILTIADIGYANASLARIAERAGIGKSVISYHFASKSDLLEAIFARVVQACWEHMEAEIDRAGDAPGKIAAYITSQIGYMRDHRAQLLAMGSIAINHRAPDGELRFLEEATGEEIAMLSAFIREGQESGAFRRFDARVMAITLTKAVEGALSEWAMRPDIDLTGYGEELVALFARAMRAEGGE